MERGMKPTTIYDISQKAGVSIATVSRVINGSSNVSEKTKKRVLDIIHSSNYEPNIFARGLGTGSMKTIGILCADVADIYLANAVSYLERELKFNGFESILNCTGYNLSEKKECLRQMESKKVDAVIMVGSQYIEKNHKDNKYIIDASNNIPVMLLNGFLDGDNIYCNLSDDYEAFRNATDYFIKRGRKRTLFVFREDSYSMKQKKDGYLDALLKNDIENDNSLIIQCSGRMSQIKEAMKENFGKDICFDSILACDDELAIGAMKFLKAIGKRIPEDVEIIGCNNSVLSISCEPEMSSIDNKCETLCINTVNSLMRVLNGSSIPKKTMISADYVERNTTK